MSEPLTRPTRAECKELLERPHSADDSWTLKHLLRAHLAMLDECESLRKDKGRLDWLESQETDLSVGRSNHDDSEIVVSSHTTERYQEWVARTLREAVDAAIKTDEAIDAEGEGESLCGKCAGAQMYIYNDELEDLKEQLRQSQEVSKALQNELDNDRRMHTSSRIYCHVAPNPSDIERNRAKEPDGERLRQELTEWIERNGVVSMMLDTPTHYVEMGIAKLPPRIKPILTLWGSIYQIDDESRAAIALAEQTK